MQTSYRSIVLDSALSYIAQGLPVFPVHKPTDAGCSCKRKSCRDIGKHPVTPNGFKDATLDERQVRSWFDGKFKGYNIGVLCGIGHICLDVDPKNHGLDSLEELVEDIGQLPDTWIEDTGEDAEGNRGKHYWFTIPKDLRGETLKTRKPLPGYTGVDLLASNQYAVVTPSVHASGVQYDVVVPMEEVVDAPKALLALTGVAEEEPLTSTSTGVHIPTGIRPGPEVRHFLRHGDEPPGGQRQMATKAARALWGLRVSQEDAVEMIFKALEKCEWSGDPWTEKQVARLVADEYAAEPKALENPLAGSLLDTDAERAYKLFEFSRGNIRCEWASKKWYFWNATRWEPDRSGQIPQLMSDLAFHILQQAAFEENPETVKMLTKQAKQMQQARHKNNAISWASELRETVVQADDFDRDSNLLNALNAIVDLHTGECFVQKPQRMMSNVTRAAYRENAQSDIWDEVISDACGGNRELIDFVQLAFGYAATGSVREDCFFYIHGPGGTGKTTVLEAVAHVLGTYATAADPDSFMLSDRAFAGGTRADLAALRGKRFVISTEIAQRSKFSSATINRLTGRDTIAARIPYAREPIVFKPNWTLLFAANNFPSVPDTSKRDGFWRRVKVIPFTHQLDHMNTGLPHVLAQRVHAEAILKWIVDGAVRWYQEYAKKNRQLVVPASVIAATAEVQYDADYMNEFWDLLVQDPDAKVPKPHVFKCYQQWADANGFDRSLTQWAFSRRLKEALGIRDKPARYDGRTQRCWIGLRIDESKLEGMSNGGGSIRIKGKTRKSARK